MDKEQVKKDFEFLKDDERVLSVLVFGSQITGRTHERSDIDVCIVAPDADPWGVLKQVFSKIDTEKKNYDVHVFEEFTLRLKHYVMENYETLWTRDKSELETYFYSHRKLWNDQAKARGVAASPTPVR
ncbi:hypothetical protein AKJ48_03830 [candidate division MSBL1 archaeon SCGC-AAA261O19]|uniref:Polymerase beta nucleotidyltransferase domain-containing protein n=1 Tax=candidate division MSBL1 archaeon SCGC-AAA261O19 TaxID=1698277 RepID=A0A133VAR2_9EURY|nr:hypothetical protein AKJ48_03830 [candidate division MSBL1 archaeon SCGC-AAA261O19]